MGLRIFTFRLMCGIAGYCGPSRRFNQGKLALMLRAIKHRGPDDTGIFHTDLPEQDLGVWLGSRRLAIQDLSPAGRQPMTDAATGSSIAFNGELYNFRDLRSELEQAGCRFHSRCDTEVALRSWCAGGIGAVSHWRGMFGAAVWDAPSQTLWLLRDPWGIKPLYYRRDAESLAFCSEIRGLLAAGLTRRELSRRGVEDFLQFGAPQDPVTILRGVYALLPGHALRWSRGRMEIRRYAARPSPIPGGPEAVEPMLREIVRQQLISDVPAVVFLSGGVDSSVIALLAREEAGVDVHTMTITFSENGYSEREFARRVAAHAGTRHHEVPLSAGDARCQALEAISRMDQPSVDGVNTYVISGAAKRSGFTVALSGVGGDEFFGGYSTFRRTALLGKLGRMAGRMPALAGFAGHFLATHGTAGAQKLGGYLKDEPSRQPYFVQRTLFFPAQIAEICACDAREAEADRLAEERRQNILEEAGRLDPLNQVSLLEARVYMANTLLRDSDQMSMAHSLELRVPFVDHLLAEFLLGIPGAQKGFGRAGKLWLRQAFGHRLPSEVFQRKKMGFTLPFPVWLKGPLAKEVSQALDRNPHQIWRREAALRVWNDFLRGRVGWSRPWALYVLSRWAEKTLYA